MNRIKGVAATIAILAVAGCAEANSSSEINVPAPPIDPQMIRDAEQVLEGAPPPPPGSCCIGVIVTEGTDPWAVGVLESNGSVTYLTYAWGCKDDGGAYADQVLPVTLDVGDLITWTTTDHRLCIDEVAMVRKAAVGATPNG